jgi:Zn-dependent M28 family amino/carboxypeptidase
MKGRAGLVRLALLTALGGCAPRAAGTEVLPSSAPIAPSSGPTPAVSSGGSATASATPSAAVPATDPLSSARLLADVAKLTAPAWRGRGSGTDDERAAADWLATELDEAGVLAPPGLARVQEFELPGGRKSRNVLGWVPGSNALAAPVVLGAHYDHLGVVGTETFFGAEDNASGTAVVLGIARDLQRAGSRPPRSVLVAFFGAEEIGLRGSRRFVATAPASAASQGPAPLRDRFFAMVNVDMIGRPLVDDPKLWFAAHLLGVLPDVEPELAVGALLPDSPPPALAPLVRRACDGVGLRAVFPEDLPESLRGFVTSLARGRGDHAPFESGGVPTVFFSSGESPDYHRPSDTADKLDGALMERRARCIVETVSELTRRQDLTGG